MPQRHDGADGAQWPINRNAFVAYVREVLVPGLSPDDIVIMDNL